jgi:predicted RNA-binding Zn ribbon-like protein
MPWQYMTTRYELIAGRLCLDFVNTVSLRPLTPASRDYLRDYGGLLAWSRQSGCTTPAQARALATVAAARPRAAQATLRTARALRECLHALFTAVMAGRKPAPAPLAHFDAALATTRAQQRLRYRAGRYELVWAETDTRLDSMLWPVLLSAERLLCDDDHARLGVCSPPEGCGWLYYDTSKNRSRRWCSMRSCGNAVKARRHYQRHRSRRAR